MDRTASLLALLLALLLLGACADPTAPATPKHGDQCTVVNGSSTC